MSKVIAILAIAAFSVANNVAMMWFVYGLWPLSWVAYAFFSITVFLFSFVYRMVIREN